jgi:serine protease inhibitor
VDEHGTKAAAVTSVGIHALVVMQTEKFIADHPFLLVLRDDVNKVNLFMGRVNQPEAL